MSEEKCCGCNGKATRIRERADFGAKADRIYTCDSADCQPDTGTTEKWHTFPIDMGTLNGQAPPGFVLKKVGE